MKEDYVKPMVHVFEMNLEAGILTSSQLDTNSDMQQFNDWKEWN